MKIKLIDSSTKKPLINSQVQIEIKGQNGGQFSLTSDMDGMVELDDKFQGQQISGTHGTDTPTQDLISVTANDNAVLLVGSLTTKI